MKIYELEQTGALKLLVFLSNYDEIKQQDLLDRLGIDFGTLGRAMSSLKSLKLANDEKRIGGPSKRFYWITDKGRKTLHYLMEIEKILKN